jgi:polyphosphate glucokinase
MGGGRRILVVDVGGKNIKCRCSTTPDERRKTPSGPGLTPEAMVAAVRELCADWDYDAVSLGLPGPVRDHRVTLEPVNLGRGWVGFDLAGAFGVPTRVVNDAAMQALGSYAGGRMLFLGLGTGLGTTLVADGLVIAMELGHLPYGDKHTFEDCVGQRGLDRLGKKRWLRAVRDVTLRLKAALVADYVVLGGGNAKLLDEPLPEDCRLGDNNLAYEGGLRLWDEKAPGGDETQAPHMAAARGA